MKTAIRGETKEKRLMKKNRIYFEPKNIPDRFISLASGSSSVKENSRWMPTERRVEGGGEAEGQFC